MTSSDKPPCWQHPPKVVPDDPRNPQTAFGGTVVNGVDTGATLKRIGVYRELTGVSAITIGLSDGRRRIYPSESNLENRKTVYTEFVFNDSELMTQLSLWPSIADPKNFLGRIRFETTGVMDSTGDMSPRVFDSGRQLLPRAKIGDSTGLDITDAYWADVQGQGVPNDYGRTINGRFVVTLANLGELDTDEFRVYDYDRDNFGIGQLNESFWDENEVGVDVGSGICVGISGGTRVQEPSGKAYIGSVAFMFMKPIAFATVEVRYPTLQESDVADSLVTSELVASRRFSRAGAKAVDASTNGAAGTMNPDDTSKYPRDAIPDGQHVYTVNEVETWTHMPWLALAAGAKIVVLRGTNNSPSVVQTINNRYKINLSATSYTSRPRRQTRDIAWSNTITVPRGKVIQTNVYAVKCHIQTDYQGKLRVDFLEPSPEGTFNRIYIGAGNFKGDGGPGWSTYSSDITPIPWQGIYEAIKYAPFLYQDTDDHGEPFQF